MSIFTLISIIFFILWFALVAILVTATIIYQDDTARQYRAISALRQGKPDSYKRSRAMKILQKIPVLRHKEPAFRKE